MTQEDTPRAMNEPTKLRPYARPHVLIVTDDPGLHEFLNEGLMYGGFWTSTVSSSIQVLEVFRLRSFDIVLVDAGLSGMGGIEVVRRLRGRSDRVERGAARTDVPIVVIAATAKEATLEEVEAAGADDFVVAPIEIVDLVQLLNDHFERWREKNPGRPLADEANFSS